MEFFSYTNGKHLNRNNQVNQFSCEEVGCNGTYSFYTWYEEDLVKT